ncbi:hypothetical protein [uncultured Methanobrevibacter sp.]|uniref:hypothetical protein n=1 Tax=uncultured Methanobrevibacter sp. TaxID=253161 RepID=UPI0025E853D6|nr:hypothetical protein [uncultured Methanobrevibacter sp.]
MNYKKLILVGCISAFVAILTSILGVAGTVIGSVISSVLYNMLSEALENPVSNANFKSDFEWELAYVFPLAVIALIQLLLIFALLAEMGFLPHGFVNFYMSIQNLADNNLYRILGIALLFISAYPWVLKPEFVKKEHGIILIIVGLIFLARGFVDSGLSITELYNPIFSYFDLPIAIIAFLLITFVIVRILYLSTNSENEAKIITSRSEKRPVYNNVQESIHHKKEDLIRTGQNVRKEYPKKVQKFRNDHQQHSDVKFRGNIRENKPVDNYKPRKGINRSSGDIHFESNDLLDDYKK